MASPLKGRTPTPVTRWSPSTTTAGSSWGIAFNRAKPPNGVGLRGYLRRQPGTRSRILPKDYLRTVIVGKRHTVEVIAGIFQDKPMLEVDRSRRARTTDNVYFCWTSSRAAGRNKIYFTRSTDHGATFSRPMPLVRGLLGAGL